MSTIRLTSDGFTAIELLVMLVILLVTFTAFSSSFNTIQTINNQANDLNVANSIAFAKVQEYENKTFASIPSTTPLGTLVEVENFSTSLPSSLQQPRTGKVYVNTVSTTLKQVVVDVKYGRTSARQNIVQYADFIQKNGL